MSADKPPKCRTVALHDIFRLLFPENRKEIWKYGNMSGAEFCLHSLVFETTCQENWDQGKTQQ